MNNNDTIKKEIKNNNQFADKKELANSRFGMKKILNDQYDFLRKFIKKKNSILDLGCGTGDFLEYCQKNKLFVKYSGIDPSDRCLELASKKLSSDTNLIHSDIENITIEKYRNIRPDLIILRGVIHHLENPMNCMKKINKILNQKDQLLIFEGNKESLYRKLILSIADFFKIKHEISQFEHKSYGQVREILQNSGFSILEVKLFPGFYLPFAYLNIKNHYLWKFLIFINGLLGKILPKIFGWWMIILAEKVKNV